MKSKKSDSKKTSSATVIRVPLVPLRDVIIFPGMVVPLFVGRDKSIRALYECVEGKKSLFLVTQKQASILNPREEDLYSIGVCATILQTLKLPDETVKVLVEGKHRGRIKHYYDLKDYAEVEVEVLRQKPCTELELKAIMRSIKESFALLAKFNKRISHEVLHSVNYIEDAEQLEALVLSQLNLKLEQSQELLSCSSRLVRMENILHFLQAEVEILQVEKRIHSRVKKQMERSQKEYYLNEQMQAIQKELGEKDEFKADLIELERAIRKKKLSVEAKDRVIKELRKLKIMSPMSAEAAVIRNYIDWILQLPWLEFTNSEKNLQESKDILEADHYGLKEVKERIIESLAVRLLEKNIKGQVLCLVGPPGVGKTSLARSIAAALGKKFVRCSLGGVRDEAEIRGHRRTYVGALPGKIIQSLKKAGSSNPVFLLDEVDKVNADVKGDPASALLEVLDPEQNYAFVDHYLEVDYDLSNVMFVLTANYPQQIPRPLLDRMEIIHIPGYTENEKFHIVQQYLIQKQQARHGFKDTRIVIDESVIRYMIRCYTREAGVRSLERCVAKIFRKLAQKVVTQQELKRRAKDKKLVYKTPREIVITLPDVQGWLGPERYLASVLEKKSEIGLANGLAYTEVGGELLHIEVVVLAGKGQVKVTGKLGEVMQESAAAAMSFARSRASILGLEKDFYQTIDIHLHAPEGSVPKDGPSAGITMATAIISALLQCPVKKEVAMTGELTLRGRVLAVGGLKEKLLAAKMAGIATVILPKANKHEVVTMDDDIKDALDLQFVDTADEVIRLALDLKDPDFFLKNKSLELVGKNFVSSIDEVKHQYS